MDVGAAFQTSSETQAKIAALSVLTQEQLDAIALKGETILLCEVMATNQVPPRLQGDWAARVVDLRVDTGEGKLVLLPTTPRAREIWRDGQAHLGIKAGLTEEHAMCWAESRTPRKHAVLKHLAKVMYNERIKTAYGHFKREFEQSDIQNWMQTWGITDKISVKQRITMIEMIKEFDAYVRCNKGGLSKGLQGIVIQPKIAAPVPAAAVEVVAEPVKKKKKKRMSQAKRAYLRREREAAAAAQAAALAGDAVVTTDAAAPALAETTTTTPLIAPPMMDARGEVEVPVEAAPETARNIDDELAYHFRLLGGGGDVTEMHQ
jgi:hypothetical protein